ncbi:MULTISPECIES: CC0125/CC1285 family lipoprotein [Acinetobacter]|jgi:hypothetical protein|uniref:CC0125/CC1285 family lipoprotein n=1 Tax=Acinetobacter TaxID=469 RepID=UPI00103D4212|nr:hypothetical protein [Acinetobacter sp. ANC 3781]TCB75973.1 hypothetical protein E0H89_10670 [Acinetobacter sp. ANC 3781]
MKNSIMGLSIVAAIALSGCATTPSKPLTFDQLGQFSNIPLNSQSYRISFQARPNMSFGTAEEITLVKAAQTTLQNGFRYFKVLNDPSNRSQAPRQAVVYSTPMYYPYGYYSRYPGFWPDPFYDMPRVVNIDPVEVSYTIECYKDQKKAPNDAFDAYLILQSLGQKYGLSPTGQVLQPPVVTPKK